MEPKYKKKRMKQVPLQIAAFNCDPNKKQGFQQRQKPSEYQLLQELIKTADGKKEGMQKPTSVIQKKNPVLLRQDEALGLNISKKPQFIRQENYKTISQRFYQPDIYISQMLESGGSVVIPEVNERIYTPNPETPYLDPPAVATESPEKAAKAAELANYMAILSSNKYKVKYI